MIRKKFLRQISSEIEKFGRFITEYLFLAYNNKFMMNKRDQFFDDDSLNNYNVGFFFHDQFQSSHNIFGSQFKETENEKSQSWDKSQKEPRPTTNQEQQETQHDPSPKDADEEVNEEDNIIQIFDENGPETFNHVFEELDQNQVQKKNTNFIKFVIKSYFRCLKMINSQSEQYDPLWMTYNLELKKEVFKYGYNNMTRTDLMKILDSGNPNFQKFEQKNRLFIRKMLRKPSFINKKIMENEYIKSPHNRRQYCLAIKVFLLRFCSKSLINRYETK